jgi:hypothetical protein
MADTLVIAGFKGISRRMGDEGADPRTAWTAENLDLTLGGDFERRDGLEKVMDLDPASVGLYEVNGQLRALIPGGQGHPLHTFGPLAVQYDHLSDAPAAFMSRMARTTPGSQIVTLAANVGEAWPAWASGATLTVTTPSGSTAYTVTSRVSDRELQINLPAGGVGITDYPFTLVSGLNNYNSISVGVVAGSPIVTLTGATWPADVRDTKFRIAGFDATVLSRPTPTTIIVAANWPNSTESALTFEMSNIPAAYPTGALKALHAVELMGVDSRQGGWPYIVVERYREPGNPSAGTYYEHHWIKRLATSTALPPLTYITLPFSPGRTLAKSTGRLFAGDAANGVVRFSSIQFGPSDWNTEGDAGFLPTLSHVAGRRDAQGLGFYDGQLAVIYADSVQLWALAADPAEMALSRVLYGPGTEQPLTVANVLGDLFYFTAGGFRSLRTQTISGKIQEQDDIGGDIVELTKNETARGIALWSQKRGQYLCAFGSRVYAFRYAPQLKVRGWTTWELGVPVDYMLESAGVLYIRSGNTLYRFNPEHEDGSTFTLETQFLGGKDTYARKRFDWLEAMQQGTSKVRFFVNPRNTDHYLNGPTIKGSTTTVDHIPVGALTQAIRVRFQGDAGRWNLGQIALRFTDTRW